MLAEYDAVLDAVLLIVLLADDNADAVAELLTLADTVLLALDVAELLPLTDPVLLALDVAVDVPVLVSVVDGDVISQP